MNPDHKMLQKIKDFRKELHRFPELSGSETETVIRLKGFLKEAHPDEIIEELGGQGLALIYNGNLPGPSVMLRAETDALPIQEENIFGHHSQRKGISHKCGHDGHMSILAGFACILEKSMIQRGRLILLFQPAEETGTGAKALTADKRFADIQADYIFALHNWPGYPTGQLVIRSGSMFSASTGMAIKLTGKSSHAMAPEEGNSPAEAIMEIYGSLKELYHPDKSSDDFSLITTVGMQLGSEDYGVSPAEGALYLTLRAYRESSLKQMLSELQSRIKNIAKRHSLQVQIVFKDRFPEARNDNFCVERVIEAAERLDIPVHSPEQGLASSEDIGHLFQKARKGGAIFLLGSGEQSAPLHSFEYDFEDKLIEPAIKLFGEIVNNYLKKA